MVPFSDGPENFVSLCQHTIGLSNVVLVTDRRITRIDVVSKCLPATRLIRFKKYGD